ncbi:hypothetical protein FACS1894201_07680 [Bacteroidia bacterium]|nr:hypothetical protein FACS1894201_07680 [Bacteroidia bacterium]
MLSLFGQTVCTGSIQDSLQTPVSFANVYVRAQDNNIVLATLSDEQGNYTLTMTKQGYYTLFFAALGYHTQSYDFTVTDSLHTITKTITLKVEPLMLKTVDIKLTRPIEIKGDTIIYNVADFTYGTEVVLEDLLKNLPGFRIEDNGIIRIGHRTITKVLVEGDDILGSGYTILTQGLRADAIDKVEVIHNYSENRLLKRYKKESESVINIRLKKTFLSNWFGNADIGGDVLLFKNYLAKGNIMKIGDKLKSVGFANLNNVGTKAIADVENIIRSENYEITKMQGRYAQNLLYFEGERPDLKDKRSLLNNEKMVAASVIYHPTKSMKIQNVGILDSDVLSYHNNYTIENILKDDHFKNITETLRKLNTKFGFGKLDWNWDISPNVIVDYSLRYAHTNQNGRGDLIFNNDSSVQTFNSTKQRWDQRLCLTNNINETDVILVKGIWNQEVYPQYKYSDQFVYTALFPAITADALQQASSMKTTFWGGELHHLHTMDNGGIIETEGGYQRQQDRLLSEFSLFSRDTLCYVPDSMQNNLEYITNDLYLGTKLQLPISKSASINAGLYLHQINNQKLSDTNLSQTTYYLNPIVSFVWRPKDSRKHYIGGDASYTTKPTTIVDIYDRYVETTERIFSKGAGAFNQLKYLSASFYYNYHSVQRLSYNINGTYVKNYDFYSSNSYCLLYTSPSPRDRTRSRMPSSA